MYLIDTNVMIAASAVNMSSSLINRAMPSEIEYRDIIFQWLVEFDESEHCMVMDEEDLIQDEYDRNMPFNQAAGEQEYGVLVWQSKILRGQVEFVPIDISEENAERIALLEPPYDGIVTDREDRKWVACALSANTLHDCMPVIVYAAETDWFVIESELKNLGLSLQRLLPDEWYESRV